MTEKHTPRPWELGIMQPPTRSNFSGSWAANIFDSYGRGLAAVCFGTDVPGSGLISVDEAVANGHLMAAAPELFLACEKALDALEDAVDNASDPQAMEDWQNERHEAIRLLNAAILKATSKGKANGYGL